MQIMTMATEAMREEIELCTISTLTGVPVEELRPKPQLLQYDPKPLYDAIMSDSLDCGTASVHGHGASDDYTYLYDKKNAWFSLSKMDYTELIRLAKIGLQGIAV